LVGRLFVLIIVTICAHNQPPKGPSGLQRD
jgi:hypothetical protein